MKPQSVQDFGNGAQSGVAVLTGTQNAVSYVLGLRTPLLRQGEVTVFFFRTFLVLFVEASVFCFRRVFIAYYRVSCYIFFSVSAGQHSKSRPCLLRLRGMYYRLCDVVCFIIFSFQFAFALFFIGVIYYFGQIKPGHPARKWQLPLCSRIVWDYLCRGGLRAG